MLRAGVRCGVVAAVLAAVACTPATAIARQPAGAPAAKPGAQTYTPVIQRVMSRPRWFKGDDGAFHLEYEDQLVNGFPVPVTVTQLAVLGKGGSPIATLAGDELTASMSLQASPNDATTTLPPSSVGVVWIDLAFAKRSGIPRRIEHRLTVDVPSGIPVPPTITDTGAKASVQRRPPPVIGPPLIGAQWNAIVGAHRRALQPVNGGLHLAQRFAIDWNRLTPDDRVVTGDIDLNTSYPSYGQPVVAVGDGKVVAAVDGLPDQIPNHPQPVGADEADGNYVIIRFARHEFAGYAHLIPGSVAVHPGDRVREGDQLGELGNSGSSTGPHLHFQLMTRPSLLDADGLPFSFHRFHLDGRIASLQALIEAGESGNPVAVNPAGAGERRRQGLTGLEVLAF